MEGNFRDANRRTASCSAICDILATLFVPERPIGLPGLIPEALPDGNAFWLEIAICFVVTSIRTNLFKNF